MAKRLFEAMYNEGLVKSRAEAKRLCHHGAIKINNEPAESITVRLMNGDVVTVGKRHKFIVGRVVHDDLDNKTHYQD